MKSVIIKKTSLVKATKVNKVRRNKGEKVKIYDIMYILDSRSISRNLCYDNNLRASYVCAPEMRLSEY